MPRNFRFRIIVTVLALLASILGILEHEDLLFHSTPGMIADSHYLEQESAVSGAERLFRTAKEQGVLVVRPTWVRRAVCHYGMGVTLNKRVSIQPSGQFMMTGSLGIRLRL